MARRTWGLIALALSACAPWTSDPDEFTEQELALIQTLGLPAVHPAAPAPGSSAELGQKLFYDPLLAAPIAITHADQPKPLGAVGQPGMVACADCHDPRAAFSDIRSAPNNVSLGVNWTGRNAPGLTNVARYTTYAWDGRGDSLPMQVAIAYEARATMAGDPLIVAQALYLNPKYRQRYAALGFSPPLSPDLDPASPDAGVFAREADGGIPEAQTPYLREVAKHAYAALADYIALLTSTGSPFDEFALEGNRDAMDPDARKGLKLFLTKAGCIECHHGPQFTDNEFHVIGVHQEGPHVPGVDQGRFEGIAAHNKNPYRDGGLDPPTDADKGAFRTKSLRNVARTGPWMHGGQFDSLDAIVRYYNAGGDRSGPYELAHVLHPLELTDDEQRQVVAFLHSLDGEEIPLELGCGDVMSDGGSRFPVCP